MSSPSPTISPPPLKRHRISSSPPRQLSSITLQPPPPALAHKSLSSAILNPLRIYSWNINGITPFLHPSTPKITKYLTSTSTSKPRPRPQPTQPSLRANIRRWKWPHILALQEVKIAPIDNKTQATVRRAVNAPLDSEDEDDENRVIYDAHICLPKDKHNATGFGGKVYGVCTLTRRDLGDLRTLSAEWDLEGRVLLTEIPERGLVVINVYAVNGTTYDNRDPSTGKVVGTRHDRKRRFHSLLRNEVDQYENQGWNVVLAGDMNISRTKIDSFPQLRMGEEHVRNRADFEGKFITDLEMIDTFRVMRGEERKFTYRPTGKPWGTGGDRVDMILVSKGLKDYVEDADILDSEEERGPSDHVPLFVEVAFCKDRETSDSIDKKQAIGGEKG